MVPRCWARARRRHDRRGWCFSRTPSCVLSLMLVANALLAAAGVAAVFVAAGMSPRLGSSALRSTRCCPGWCRGRDGRRLRARRLPWHGGPDRRTGDAGVLIATIGLGATYAVDAALPVSLAGRLARMRAVPRRPTPPPEPGAIREGWRYAVSRQEMTGSYAVDINAMLFGIPVALFRAVADRYGGPGLGCSMPPAGRRRRPHAGERLGRARAPPRHRRSRSARARLRRGDRRLRGRGLAAARARRARRTPGRRTVVGDLPPDLWNQTIPGPHARPARGHEQLSTRSGPHSAPPLGCRRVGDERPVLDRRPAARSASPAPLILCSLLPRFGVRGETVSA